MSSLKMTFSLTSLILLFVMAVAPTSVMAAAGGPTVTDMALHEGTGVTQARSAVIVKVTFSDDIVVSTTPADGFSDDDVEWNVKDAGGNLLLTAPSTTSTAHAALPSTATVSTNMFIFSVDVSAQTAARTIAIRIPADKVKAEDKTLGGPGLGNQASEVFEFDLPPVVPNTAVIEVAQKMDGNEPVADRYTLKVTFYNDATPPVVVDSAPNPVPQIGDIMVTSDLMVTPVNDGGPITNLATPLVLEDPDTPTQGVYVQDYAIDTASLDGMTVDFQMLGSYIMSDAVTLGTATPAPPASEPTFDGQTIADIVLWVGQDYNMDPANRILLPLARGGLNDNITYSVMPALPDGLEASAVDAQTRFITGSVDTAQAETDYMWIATNQDGGTDEIEFSITVKDPVVPGAPTAVMADEAARGVVAPNATANTVMVSWMAPSDDPEMAYGADIDSYMVYYTNTATDAEMSMSVDDTMYMVDAATGEMSYTTASLAIGKYEFEVAAVNSAGTGSKSAPAVMVVVADPPGMPMDLRAAQNPNGTRITLSWNAAQGEDPNAPTTGHTVYITHPDDEESTEDADENTEHQIEGDLEAGRYVFRVAAVNLDGEGQRSSGTEFELNIPTAADNQGPTFGIDAKISAIMATVDMAITGVTLPAATDPDGDDSAIEYTLDPDLPDGLDFNAATRFLSGEPEEAMARTVYTYTATDSGGKTAALSFEITVYGTAPPVISDDLDATHDPATGVTTIGTAAEAGTMIAANGFATIGSGALPDLEEFFELGGTIGLSNGDATDDKNSRTVIISEILWGLDLGAMAEEQSQWQFIELYNTTGAAIDLNGWTLTFTQGNVVPASDIDQMSNRGRTGWDVDSGDTGKSGRVTGTTAVDLTSAITPQNIVSMYRNIDYKKVEDNTAKRDELVKGIPGGNAKGSWKASQRRSTYNRWIYDSKRAKHFKPTGILSPSSVAGTPFRINEIGNDTGNSNDWVELHNVTDATQSLKNYAMSVVTAKGTDTKLFDFKDQDWKVSAKSYVVISTRHPRDTDLAQGKDISVADDQEENRGASHLYVVKSVNLPDDGKFALILRNAHDKQGGDGHLIDVVATRQGAFADNSISSDIWPLKATGLPHDNVVDGGDENFAAGKVYQRNSGNGRGEKQLAVRGFTGVGYDRAAESSGANGGTPGYDNGAIKDKIMDGATVTFNGTITFSEIMLDVGSGRQNLPQWIELYNSSMTQAVNLNGWKLTVENTADVDTALDAVLTLGSMVVSPNQTVLIVTNSGRISDPDHFPSDRVLNLWTTKVHRDALEIKKRTDQVFSTSGLYLKLTDTKNNTVDEFGNLDGNRRTRDELMDTWMLPMSDDEDGRRSSLIRIYASDNNPATHAVVEAAGTEEDAWVLADETNLAFAISPTYFGDPDDFGTPGQRGGGPLPVSLSKFRPERLDDGSIVIRWVTESELNNAGFNILRSDTSDGEYTQLNTSLIAGNGTTSERSVYEWKDASAKPNVVYYYQIQDVSLDGEVTTLRQSRLKGHVSPAGKATTTWGEIKALQ